MSKPIACSVEPLNNENSNSNVTSGERMNITNPVAPETPITKKALNSASIVLPPLKPHPCDVPGCGKSFKTIGNLKRHKKSHSGERNFFCQYCKKRFIRKEDMIIHERIHTGERPYACTYVECGKRFARSSDLRSHERVHRGEKPFACTFPQCDRRFSRRYELRKHLAKHEATWEKAQHRVLGLVPTRNQVPGNKGNNELPITRHPTEVPSPNPQLPFSNLVPLFNGPQPRRVIQPLAHQLQTVLQPLVQQGQSHPSSSYASSNFTLEPSRNASTETAGVVNNPQHWHNNHHHHPASTPHPIMCPPPPPLYIKHGEHFDLIRDNTLICEFGNKQLQREESVDCRNVDHQPGCGHYLRVRHDNHFDYIMDNSLFCTAPGASALDPGAEPLIELLEEDFSLVVSALSTMNSDIPATNLGRNGDSTNNPNLNGMKRSK